MADILRKRLIEENKLYFSMLLAKKIVFFLQVLRNDSFNIDIYDTGK